MSTMQSPNMGTVNVSLSDPPSCMPPVGNISNVWITVRSVQAHTSATATENKRRMAGTRAATCVGSDAIDLFSKPDTRCVLAQLGSASLPVGNYQQIRLLLLSNTPAAGVAVPLSNKCAGNGYNCVILADTRFMRLP